MKRAWPTLILLVAMLSVAGPLLAQRRGGTAVPAPRVSFGTRSGVAGRGGGNVTIINNFSTRVPVTSVVPVDSFAVPGLGFDFVHAAAVNRAPNVGVPVSFVPGSFITLPFFATQPEVIVVQSPPPVIVVQAPPPVILREGGPAETTSHPAPAPTAEAMPKAGSAHETAEYVFVQRDGRVVFAVAFAMEGERVFYVTREGNRRTLAIAAIDFDATTRMNEERGIRFALPVSRRP